MYSKHSEPEAFERRSPSAESAKADYLMLTDDRQTAFRTMNNRFNEIEGGFHNLEETVPPHARDWWQENDPAWQAQMGAVRAELNELSHDLAGLLELKAANIDRLLAELEMELGMAREGLGSRTAAGRAKEN
jgi:hypothetical protein